MTQQTNDQLVLIVGKSATGKSASLIGLRNPEGVMYLNCESGKKLPFRDKFQKWTITDPWQIHEAFQAAETMPEIHTIVVDSLTYMMDMFESLYIHNSPNGMAAWSNFQQFFKELMQVHVASSTKNVIFTAHTSEEINGDHVLETKVPVKGALKNNGIESYFSVVMAAKKMTLKDLKEYENELLTISEEEEALGFKHVFQTRITKQTKDERLRGPFQLFSVKETFINNDAQAVLDRLFSFYND